MLHVGSYKHHKPACGLSCGIFHYVTLPRWRHLQTFNRTDESLIEWRQSMSCIQLHTNDPVSLDQLRKWHDPSLALAQALGYGHDIFGPGGALARISEERASIEFSRDDLSCGGRRSDQCGLVRSMSGIKPVAGLPAFWNKAKITYLNSFFDSERLPLCQEYDVYRIKTYKHNSMLMLKKVSLMLYSFIIKVRSLFLHSCSLQQCYIKHDDKWMCVVGVRWCGYTAADTHNAYD